MSDTESKNEAHSSLSTTSLTSTSTNEASSKNLTDNTGVQKGTNEIADENLETEPYYIFEESELPLGRFLLSETQSFVTLKELREAQSKCENQKKRQTSGGKNRKKKESASMEVPKPFASSQSKEQMLSKVNLSIIDSGVEACKAPTAETTWMEFAQQLTAHCSTDLERVRAIYYWLGYFDLGEVALKETFEKDSLMDVVSRLRQEKLFSALFHRLCLCCDVPIHLISGYKKGTNYRIGHRLNDPEDVGMWFAVFVDEEWRFVDAHWGCCSSFGSDSGEWQKIDEKGQLEMAKKNKGEIVFNCNEYYFLTDPECMIFKHFPFDPDWQLLVKPISLETFEEMPFIFPNKMTEMGLKLVSHPKGVLRVPPSGLVELQFEETGPKRMYDTQLYLHNGSNRESCTHIELPDGQEMSLNRFQMIQRCGSQISIRVIPPKCGKYLLILKGSTVEEKTNETSTVDATAKDEIIHYVIHCPRSKINVTPMPTQLGDAEWGMGARADMLGVIPISHENGEVTLDDGEVEIRICADRSLDYQCELSSENIPVTNDAANKIVHWPEEKGEHVFRVMAPDEGLYALSIMAREHDSNKDFSQVGAFIVEADIGAEDILEYPVPDMKNCCIGWIDINDGINSNEKPLSPYDKPHILCREAELSITWQITKSSFLSAQLRKLESAENNVTSNCDDRLFIDYSMPEKCAFQMKFPQLGNYMLHVLRNNPDNPSAQQTIFTYFIRALGQPSQDQQPFPKVNLNHWRQGFKLVQPKNMYLQPQSKTQIIICAPAESSVKSMALLDPKQKVHLFERVDKNKWELNFTTGYAGSAGGTLSVLIDQSAANKKNPSYEKLLDFHILGGAEQKDLELRKELNEAGDRQKKARDALRKEKKNRYNQVKGLESEESDVDSKEKVEIDASKRASKPLTKAQKAREVYKAKEQLLRALTTNCKSKIEKRLNGYRSLIKKENSLVNYSAEYLTMLDLKLNLQEAIQKARTERKKEPIIEAIQKIDAAQLATEIFYFLENIIAEAQTLFKNIDRCERLYVRILKMDGNTLLELRNYNNPTDDIKNVIQATLLILGNYEKRTRKWRRCQPLLKGILSSIRNFDHTSKNNHPGLAARALELMKDVVAEEIALHSAAAAAFYNWSMAIIDLVRDNTKTEDFKPASMKKQRKILKISSEEEADLVWEDNGIKK